MPHETNTREENPYEAQHAWNYSEGAGFCQECGRALTPATRHHVGSGTFCPDCASQAGSQQAWRAVYSGAPGSEQGQNRSARTAGAPRPRLAAWLGLMPGVGAMYNGQYGKGAMHLAVFVALLAVADHVSDVLYWLVWGWVAYQAFDAYHTAVARRDRQPLPDPFGFNDVGGRIFQGTPGGAHTRPGANRAASAYTSDPSFAPHASATNTYTEPTWNGENPYTASFATGERPAASMSTAAGGPSPLRQSGQRAVDLPPTPLEGVRRFPVAALWLVGLGVVFLLGNMLPSWHLSGEWIAVFLLALFATWSAIHKLLRARSQAVGRVPSRAMLCALSFPAVVLLSCLLLILNAVHGPVIARTWPIILIFWGALLFLQRLLPAPVPPRYATVPSAYPEQPYAGTSRSKGDPSA